MTILFSSRDKYNISRIGKFDYDLNKKIIKNPNLYLDIDKLNKNENLGVSYPFLINKGKKNIILCGVV